MKTFLQLAVTTHLPRHEATERVRAAVGDAGASILDAHFFGGLALSLALELPGAAVAPLLEALDAAGVHPTAETRALVAEADLARRPDAEVMGSLHVSFALPEPDVSQEIPRVPG